MVQWLSSDIYILELVFFLRVRIPEFLFSFFPVFTPSVGSLNNLALLQTVADPEGFRGRVGNRLFHFIGIFKKNERSSANRPPP